MVWINSLIAVSLKTRLPEGYCSACARWARLFVATGVAFALTLGPAIAACSYIFYFFFFQPSGFLGPNMLKTHENLHTHWNRGHLDATEAGTRAWHRGSTAPPRTQSENLMYSSHILAHIHMKLGTHIDLIERTISPAFIGSAQQEVGYLGLFKKRMLWNLIYSSEDYHPIATKLGEHDLKTLGTQNCQDIFDISNGLPVARR